MNWKTNRLRVLALVLAIIGITLFAICVVGYWKGWQWTGLVDYTRQVGDSAVFERQKTLWDWMNLLVVPFALAVGAYLFNLVDKSSDQVIAENAQQEAALQEYLNQMSELLFEKDLNTSDRQDVVRAVARARTIAILPRLSSDRKGYVVRFLHEAQLLLWDSIIGLKGADLRKVNLRDAGIVMGNLS